MKKTAILCTMAFAALLLSPSPALATPTRALIVDDGLNADGQCPGAEYSSLQDAVEAADEDGTIVVCPGLYRERIMVDKKLTIRGPETAVRELRCLEPSSDPVTDPAHFAIIEPADSRADSLLSLQAGGIEVSGLVVQGQRQSVPTKFESFDFWEASIETSGHAHGYNIHHNLIRENTVGIEFGSAPKPLDGQPSKVEGNCFRNNRWDVGNQRMELTDALITENDSYETEVMAYEIGWGYRAAENVVLRENDIHMRGATTTPYAAFYIENSTNIHIEGNTVVGPVQYGVIVFPRSDGVRVGNNVIHDATVGGIVFAVSGAATPAKNVAVRSNTVLTSNSGILLRPGAGITGAEIRGNHVSESAFSGIVVNSGNHGNTFSENVSLNNGSHGISVGLGATGNTFRANTMTGNGMSGTGGVDAREGIAPGTTALANTWSGNICVTDSPVGMICGR